MQRGGRGCVVRTPLDPPPTPSPTPALPSPRPPADGLWLQFKSLCLLSTSVEGVDVDTFRRFVPSMALEDPAFAMRVFAVLDRSCRRLITWSEFIECMVSLDSGTLEQRASFLFRCYDRSGSGELGLDDFFEFYCWSGGLDVPAGWSGPAALAAAQAAAAAAAERSKGAEGYEEGDSEGVALLETIEDPREAMLLTMYEFAEKIFASLDAAGRGRVTLEGATQALRALQERLGGGALASKDLAGVFGRAMVTATESDVSATVLASFAKAKDEQLAQRVEAQRKHAKQVGELLGTVARAEAGATARAAATMGRKKK
jgi:hypothetical protein